MLKRATKLFIVFILLCSILATRIVYLASSTDLTQAAQRQSSYTLTLSTQRGGIYDRNFNNMVNQTTKYVAVVFPDPSCIQQVLDLNPELKREEIAEQIQQGKPFLVESKKASSNHSSIQVFPVSERYRDNGIAPHLIGYLNGDGEAVCGIEQSYNELLQNFTSNYQITFQLDGTGNLIKGKEMEQTIQGNSDGGVVLTLDRGIQELAQKIGGQSIPKGAITVFDVKTSQIVACASFPTYSQNDVAASINDENKPLINRSLYTYNVGSTFKIATAATALEQGISPNYSFFCPGKIDVKGQVFKCHHLAGHGSLNMQQALEKSCNPYYINLALQTGGNAILQTASDMGFGKELELASGIVAAKGTLPSTDDLKNPAELANFGFGQGKLTANSFQVSGLLLSVLNQGKLVQPSLILGTTENGTDLTEPTQAQPPTYVMSEETASILKEDLILALKGQDTEGLKPKLTTAGGKSATAQTGTYDENGVEICQTWYTGFFPAEDPKYVITVLVEEGVSGNDTAGPIFAKLADAITLYEQK